MCGIVGNYNANQINKKDFYSLVDSLNHRGPDFQNTFFHENFALGHSRLSIIDLSENANQPFISLCKNFVLIFNGEIYNYLELKNELKRFGVQFLTNSDTEVLLNGFIYFKEKILEKLNGIFSFCILNKKENTLFFARDTNGIKPLYYFHKDKNFVFSSEIRTIKKYSSNFNTHSQIKFYVFGSVPGNNSIYQDIKEFPKSSYGILKNNVLTISKFSFKTHDEFSVKESIIKGVKMELISDAPIGIFLSGGLDSSIIATIAAKNSIEKLNTFSLVSNPEEEKFQQIISKYLKTNHYSKTIDSHTFENEIPNFLNSLDQPTIDGFNTYLLSKFIREKNIKVGISGIGSDENFYGYPSFKRLKKLRLIKKLSLNNFLGNLNSKYQKLNYLNNNNFFSYYLASRAVFPKQYILDKFSISSEEFDSIIYPTNLYSKNEFELISNFENDFYMSSQLLRDADVFGMKNSVEIRVPFLNNLITSAVKNVDKKNFIGANNKQFLVNLFNHSLPKEIYSRKKSGFELPYEIWLKNNLDSLMIDLDLKKLYQQNKIHWSKIWLNHIFNSKFS